MEIDIARGREETEKKALETNKRGRSRLEGCKIEENMRGQKHARTLYLNSSACAAFLADKKKYGAEEGQKMVGVLHNVPGQ